LTPTNLNIDRTGSRSRVVHVIRRTFEVNQAWDTRFGIGNCTVENWKHAASRSFYCLTFADTCRTSSDTAHL